MAVTTTNTAYILKTLWPQRRVDNAIYKRHALLAMLPKSEEFYGENLVLAVRYADSQGRSAAFATAQAAAGNHAGVRFYLTRAADYQVVSLTTEAILASKNDKGALIKNLDTEMASGMNNIAKSLAVSLYRGKSGYVGQIGSIAAGPPATITLANINDVTSFEVGMVLYAFTAKSGGAAHATPATATITGVDRDTGVITFADGTFAGTNWVANDYLFPNGDRGVKVSGLEDWLPSAAPTAGDSFFSVDRSVDATRLAGLRIDCSGLNPEEAVVTALSRLGREGGSPDYFFVNHLDYRNVEISLGSKVCYEDLSVGEIGFRAIKMHGPDGPVNLLADQDCPSGVGYALQMDTWKLYSLEKCPQVLDLDGSRLHRESSADRWEARIAYWANLGCTSPGMNARVSMPA